MKIGNPADKRNVVATENANAPAKGTAETARRAGVAQPAADPSAKVELSSAANLMSNPSSADFDAEKVERISQAIASGSYRSTPS
ncbi:flagellar biosynthesis anti-sigma factor FlgM [Piscinibacter aquaticus]|uniref:Negative regulator of flagellin synthesis n=1 Tax=Piscinibacter aquaticus TaxID=392597 RepID=A0A5C6U1G3_9BURK|nr:flagellar biosynthesis anti-sigma factor FlgM [Piscinibacter aquaticus]